MDRVDKAGQVTFRHRRRLHHIGTGSAYAGWRVAMLIDGLKIEIVGLDAIAKSLNNRPRKTLGYLKPSEKLAELLATTP